MLKQIKLLTLVFAMGAFVVACNNEPAADTTDGTVDAAVTTTDGQTPPSTPTAPPAEAAPVGPTTTMSLGETEYDFGSIDQGDVVSHTFQFTNTGAEALIIQNAKGSCGCTVPKWPKDPILPGETGEIQVEFNSKGKKGNQNKKVTITANTNPAQSFIYLKGNVDAPEGADVQPEPQISIQGQQQ